MKKLVLFVPLLALLLGGCAGPRSDMRATQAGGLFGGIALAVTRNPVIAGGVTLAAGAVGSMLGGIEDDAHERHRQKRHEAALARAQAEGNAEAAESLVYGQRVKVKTLTESRRIINTGNFTDIIAAEALAKKGAESVSGRADLQVDIVYLDMGDTIVALVEVFDNRRRVGAFNTKASFGNGRGSGSELINVLEQVTAEAIRRL